MRNPWLGLKSYEEGDRLYGRGKEADELANIVMNSFHTIIYGKSGIGKTSLLRAGVFPTLRYEDFLPIYIRLEHDENADEDSYLRQIENALKENQCSCSVETEHAPSSGKSAPSLQSIFSKYLFNKSRGISLTPVIVFDQFEEIFTLNENRNSAAVDKFFADLSDILNNDTDSHNYRIVFCLREDYLYYIERLSESIPAFKRNRYCLQDLTHDEAMEVITLGGVETEHAPSVPKDVAEEILHKISPDNAEEYNATILSLYMSQLFDKMVKAGATTITSSLVQQFGDDIISAFYFDSIAGISEKSIEYLEDHLVTTGGYRHNVPLEDAISGGVKSDEIEHLKERRIINVQPRQGNVLYMEYAHDVLCPIIVINREKRQLRKRTKRLKRIVAAGVVFLLCMFGIVGGFVLQNHKIKQKQEAMMLMQSRAIAGQAEQMYKEGDYAKGVALCLRALPGNLEHPNRPISYEALATLYNALYSDFACCKRVIKNGDNMRSAEFSPDSKYVVTTSDSTVRIWSVETGRQIMVLKGHKDMVYNAIFSPDGKSVLTSSFDGAAMIWNVETGKLVRTLSGHTSWMYNAKYSPDGSLIVTSANDSTFRVWNAKTGKLLKIVKCEDVIGDEFSISYDGKYMISSFNGITRFFDLTSGKQIKTLDRVFAAEISPKGHTVVTASGEDKFISLWNVETGRLVKKIGNVSYHFPTFSPDGRNILASCDCEGDDGGVCIFDVTTGKQLLRFGEGICHGSSSYSSDGKYVLTPIPGAYMVWNSKTGECVKTLAENNKIRQYNVKFSPNGQYVLSVKDEVRLWDLKQEENIRINAYSCEYASRSGIVTVEGKTMLNAVQLGDSIVIVDALSDKHLRSFYTGQDGSYISEISPNANYLTMLNYDKDVISLWNTMTGKCIRQSKCGYNNVFSPNSRMIALSKDCKTTIIVDIANNKQIQVIKDDSCQVVPLAFSPDNSRIVTFYSDSTIREYDVKTGKKVKVYGEVCPSTFDATFSYDGKCIATVSDDKVVRLWDVATGKLLKKIREFDARKVSFSPDSHYLVARGNCSLGSQFVHVWDVRTGVKIAELNHLAADCAIFTPDGNIVTASYEGIIRWRFYKPQEVIDHFRKVVGDYEFTEEEEIKYYLK